MIKRKVPIFVSITILLLPFTGFSFSKEISQTKQIGILEEIVLSKVQDILEVKILFIPYTSHHIFGLTNPNRIVVDLHNIEDIKAVRYIDVNDFNIKAVRIGMFKTDIARVVLDVEEQIPNYEIERIPGGLILKIWGEKENKQREKEQRVKDIQKKGTRKKELKQKMLKQADPKIEKIEKLEEEVKETQDELDETKKTLDEAINILRQIQEERQRRRKRFVRIEALGNLFQPEEGVLKDVYKSGMMLGAELNMGVWNFVEFWLAQKFFRKKIVEEASGVERKAELIPVEVGLKFRLNKGYINPYFGAGVGYYQYKEINPSGEIKEKEIGFIGQAGFFVKVANYLVFDIYAQYSYCRIKTELDKFSAGGFHIGVGFGFEY